MAASQAAEGKKVSAPWTRALLSKKNPQARHLPQAVGHRGYNAKFPENTMPAFKGAVEVGAHGIETDLHLSKDGLVVLSHDGNLKRCYGVDKKIIDCDWEYLSTIRNLKDPAVGMPRLVDLLEYLAVPEREHIWVLFDIKADDVPDDLVGAIGRTLDEVKPSKPWTERIVMASWNAQYLDSTLRLLPTYPRAYTNFSIPAADKLFITPGLNFNSAYLSITGSKGDKFLHKCRDDGRSVYTWTVNARGWMEWCLWKNEKNHAAGGLIDAVITDDPAMYLKVSREWEEKRAGKSTDGLWDAVRFSDAVVVASSTWDYGMAITKFFVAKMF